MAFVTIYFAIFVIIIAAVILCIFGKNKVRRISGSILCAIGFLFLYLLLAAVVPSLLIWNGLLPATLYANIYLLFTVICVGLFIVCLLLIWKPFRDRIRKIIVIVLLGAMIALTAIVALNIIYQNSLL